jgi:hypothetical protein
MTGKKVISTKGLSLSLSSNLGLLLSSARNENVISTMYYIYFGRSLSLHYGIPWADDEMNAWKENEKGSFPPEQNLMGWETGGLGLGI